MRSNCVRVAIGIALAALATACSTAVDGQGSVDAAAVRTQPGGFPSQPSAPASTAPSPPGGSARAGSSSLVARLEPMPSGAHGGHSDWALNATPTIAQFTAEVYQPQYAGAQADVLRSEGLTGIAHRLWISANGDECDEILLSFRDSSGADSRYLAATSARRADPKLKSFTIAGGTQAIGTYEPTLDTYGNIRSISYARSGSIVVEQFGFTVAHLRPGELEGWLKTQLRRL
jgi:hypothetical protein